MAHYTSAPATQMLATHCAVCGRPLLDAQSVETGMGPHCRGKYSYGKAQAAPDWGMAFLMLVDLIATMPAVEKAFQAEDAHGAANLVVHELALEQCGPRAPALVAALHTLGYHTLAQACSRGTGVKVEEQGAELIVRAPFNEAFNQACRRVPGSYFSKLQKARVVPASSKGALWAAIKATFPAGTTVFGPSKVAVLGAGLRAA